MKTDHLFYRLFQELPDSFFELIGAANEANRYRFDSIEVKQTAFRIDGVFLPTDNSPDSPIYFTEVQFREDPAIYARLLSEIFIFLRHNRPQQLWRAVVIFPSQNEDLSERERQPYAPLIESNLVQRFYLDELDVPANASLGLEIVKLVVERHPQVAPTVTRLVERVQTEVASDLERRKFIDLIETIVLYKLPNLSQEELAAMFAIDDLRQTRFAQEMKAEGREEGRQEGDRQRQRQVISQLLSRDFPLEDITQIVDLSVEEVREIVAQIQTDLQD